MTLKAKMVDFEMSHWHLDTFLVQYKPWEMREFVTFNISSDGALVSFDFGGETFTRVDETNDSTD